MVWAWPDVNSAEIQLAGGPLTLLELPRARCAGLLVGHTLPGNGDAMVKSVWADYRSPPMPV
jgi:hypothetical protein